MGELIAPALIVVSTSASRSRTTTDISASASSQASVSPTGPPPMVDEERRGGERAADGERPGGRQRETGFGERGTEESPLAALRRLVLALLTELHPPAGRGGGGVRALRCCGARSMRWSGRCPASLDGGVSAAYGPAAGREDCAAATRSGEEDLRVR
ncbi:hypothetical protein TPA0598_11_01430 [Streptomyces lydicamycinicus]|uniref:Uncharacterized protein n=1 Tax=Streptomyces lydicamycinicus TaxID=1546107 RepID=A0A0P4RFT0_9ACTN|nr:hypothetical protein TPA0598_11_01430 [Streptomyces lydicamycinicus]